MKKLLSIICTLAIVLGVVLVPGMVSVSAATTATFIDFNVVSTTMTDAGSGVYYVTGGWKDHYINTDIEMVAGKTYNVTMNVAIDNYSGLGVRLEAATDPYGEKVTYANRTNMPYAKGNKVMDNHILSYTFKADDMIKGDNKYIAFNINCAEGSATKNGVKNIRICEVPSNEGYANIRATYELGNWGVDADGNWAFMGSIYYGWQNGQYDVEISPDKYYKIDYEYKGKSTRDGGRALGWSTTADGALSSGGAAIGSTFVALPDQGVVVGSYKAYSQIVSGAALGATETNKYLTICGQNVLGAITYIRNLKVTELDAAPFFTKFTGVAATYIETTDSGNEFAYGIPANDTFGAAWGSDHYITSEYVLEPNSTYIITYDWKGHNYSEDVWFTIMNQAGTGVGYRTAIAHVSNKTTYVRQGSVLRTGSNVNDTYKYFGMMFKDYGGDPYLVKNINIQKVDEATLGGLLPSYSWGSAFTGYNETDGAYLWEIAWKGKGAFTFDYVINPEDTYKISFKFKGANRLGDVDNDAARFWALKTNTSAGIADYTAGAGVKIDTIPALDQQWGYYSYDFTFKGSDIGATEDSKYLVLQHGGYLSTCAFKDIKIVNLSQALADYSAVNAAIEAAGKLNASNYTNFDAVTAAIAAVVEGKMAAEQAVVDGYAEAINAAIEALVLKGADYSKVEAAKAAAEALEADLYTNFDAVDAAIEDVVYGLDITKQAEVDAYADAINAAIEALQYKAADYSKVEAAKAAAEALEADLYTNFDAVDAAIEDVVYGLDITKQADVDAYADAINAAIEALEYKGADYSKVEAAKAAAEAVENKENYSNWAAVEAAIEAVEYGLDITKQADVDAYAQAILDAIEALELDAAIYHADAIGTNGDSYGELTISEDGKTVTLDANGTVRWANGGGMYGNWIGFKITAPAGLDATQITVLRPDGAIRVLEDIKDGATADGRVYAHLYWNVANEVNTSVTYKIDWTTDGVYDLDLVIDFADITRGSDYSKVEAAIAAAEEYDEKLYSNWAAVADAIAAVEYGLDGSKQATIDAYAEAINAAIAALEYKGADYSAVEDAIAAAEAVENKENYSNWADVQAAIDAVDYTKNITEQADVDAYAQAILDAIEALEIDPAIYHGSAIGTNGDSHGELTISEDGKTVTLDANGLVNWAKAATGKYGNWIGFKITAPAGLDATQITILRNDGAIRILDNIKDGTTADGRAYTQMYLNVANLEGPSVTYKIDWTSDGVYDLDLVIDFADVVRGSDYSAVEAAIAAAEAIENKEQYSNWADVEAAIAAVEYGLDGSKQAVIDAYAEAINAAVANLKINGASYAAVNEAIAAANALNEANYVNYNIVEDAIANVVYDLDITKQAEVDAYAEAIYAAIDALVYADGFIEEDGLLYYVENGKKVTTKGVIKIGDNYYYIGGKGYLITGVDRWINAAEFNGLTSASGAAFEAGMYTIDENGVVGIKEDGIVAEGEYLYYYEAGAKVTTKGVVKVGNNYYYIGGKGYLITGVDRWINAAEFNGLTSASGEAFKAGTYAIDENGIVDIKDNGVYEEAGLLYYYEAGVKVTTKGVIKVGNAYYYIGGKGYIITNANRWINAAEFNGLTTSSGAAFSAGTYAIDENGIIDIKDDGIQLGTDGNLYYYENGQKVAKGLVYDEASDNYYYFGIKYYALADGSYWFKAENLNGLKGRNGEELKAGTYVVENGVVVL